MHKKAILSLLLLSAAAAHAQQFLQHHLEQAATRLHLDTALLVTPGIHYANCHDTRLVVRVDSNHVVEHIGIALFSQPLRSLQPSPIYDYLEYAIMNHRFHLTTNTLQLEELQFKRGSWTTLEQLGDTLACNINNLSDKYYQVSWQRNGNDVAVVTFPINYELLANSNRRDMEVAFVKQLRNYTVGGDLQSPTLNTVVGDLQSPTLTPTSIEGIFRQDGQSHIIPSINNHIYLQVDKEDSSRRLLFDSRYAPESIANLLLTDPRQTPAADARIEVECLLSTYKRDTVNVMLTDFLGYCRQQGCQPYYGYEQTKGGEVSATLIMSNPLAGYDHIFHITCPTQLATDELLLRATAYLFTPTSNVKDIFGSPSAESKSLMIWK